MAVNVLISVPFDKKQIINDAARTMMEIRNEGTKVVRNVLQENKICVVSRRF